MTSESYLRAVLALSAKWEIHDDLWWNEKGEFFIKCSDFFSHCTADCELIGDDDLPALEQAILDARAVNAEDFGPILWVARKRGQRPIITEIAALFDACKKEPK